MAKEEQLSAGIGKRIAKVRGSQTPQAFADAIGISRPALLNYEKGERIPDAETVAAICHKFHVDLNWLVLGKGTPSDMERTVLVPEYDIGASAGYGSFMDTDPPTRRVAVDRLWLRRTIGVSPQSVSLIYAHGDSMEPTLLDGDSLLVCHEWEPIKDGIHVLRCDGLLQVKRVQRQPGQVLRITSDNPAYEPYTVNLTDECLNFAILGRVVWAGKTLKT